MEKGFERSWVHVQNWSERANAYVITSAVDARASKSYIKPLRKMEVIWPKLSKGMMKWHPCSGSSSNR